MISIDYRDRILVPDDRAFEYSREIHIADHPMRYPGFLIFIER